MKSFLILALASALLAGCPKEGADAPISPSPVMSVEQAKKVTAKFSQHFTPPPRTIKDITAPEVLAVLRRIESRGTIYVAHRAKQVAGQVFRYAIATGRAERDPSADLKGALTPRRQKHNAAITDPVEVGKLMVASPLA